MPTKQKPPKPYRLGLPHRMIRDPWITGTDIKVWCGIAETCLDLETNIGSVELSQRIGVSYWTTHRAIKRLTLAGYLAPVEGGSKDLRRIVP